MMKAALLIFTLIQALYFSTTSAGQSVAPEDLPPLPLHIAPPGNFSSHPKVRQPRAADSSSNNTVQPTEQNPADSSPKNTVQPTKQNPADSSPNNTVQPTKQNPADSSPNNTVQTTEQNPEKEDFELSVGQIIVIVVGSVLGGLAALAALGLAVYCAMTAQCCNCVCGNIICCNI